MILIDKPYVSDFLIKTIKENKFPIVATPEAKDLIGDTSLNWISQEEAKKTCIRNPTTPVYSNSENAIHWVNNNLNATELPEKIQLFKNKIKFRELIKDIYRDYFFKGVPWQDLSKLSLKDMKFPLIIKPAVGFFSVGVHKMDHLDEWPLVLDKIKLEIAEMAGLYPPEVIDTTEFIIESYIEGEEYAIDCYYNKNGKGIVLHILHHIFSSGKDVSDRVYTSSKEMIEKHLQPIEDFINNIGAKIGLRNFPIHVEVRIDKNGVIIPIEINPLRFGGWCTTADLAWYAYGINSYAYFFNQKSPDWKEILKTRTGKKYSIIVLDNNSGYKESEIASFNYDKLWKSFKNPLLLRKIDFRCYPIFGFIFTESDKNSTKELSAILNSNLHEYIQLK